VIGKTNYSMSWYLELKKYRKKVKELLFVRSELEYQEEALKETHPIFEKYYRQYCIDHNIDLKELNKNNSSKVEDIFKQAEVEMEGLVHKPRKQKKNPTKVFDKIYRAIVKEIHPDKLSKFLSTQETAEKEEKFKIAAGAMSKEDWGKLLEVADWLNIKPRFFDGIAEQINLEIIKLKKLIDNNEKMYSWHFIECETDEQRNNVVKNFLEHLFGYKVDKSN